MQLLVRCQSGLCLSLSSLSRAGIRRCIPCHQMVCCGPCWDRKVWHVEHQQCVWGHHLHWMPERPYSWRVPEEDYGKLWRKYQNLLIYYFLSPLCDIHLCFESPRSVKRPTQWPWMEVRCLRLESVAWFLSWWSSMCKVDNNKKKK